MVSEETGVGRKEVSEERVASHCQPGRPAGCSIKLQRYQARTWKSTKVSPIPQIHSIHAPLPTPFTPSRRSISRTQSTNQPHLKGEMSAGWAGSPAASSPREGGRSCTSVAAKLPFSFSASCCCCCCASCCSSAAWALSALAAAAAAAASDSAFCAAAASSSAFFLAAAAASSSAWKGRVDREARQRGCQHNG